MPNTRIGCKSSTNSIHLGKDDWSAKCVCVYIYIYLCVCVCVCLRACVCVCVCVCVCLLLCFSARLCERTRAIFAVCSDTCCPLTARSHVGVRVQLLPMCDSSNNSSEQGDENA